MSGTKIGFGDMPLKLSSYDRFIFGTEAVLDELNKQLKGIQDRISKRGMHTVLLLWRRESMKLTPVNTENLIQSYSTYVIEGSSGVEGLLVNHASYALFVHEMPLTKVFRKPTATSKFVEIPLRRNSKKFFDILTKTARVK